MKQFATSKVLRIVTATFVFFATPVAVTAQSSAATTFVPVIYGSVEIMVPSSWVVFDGNESSCAPSQIMVLVNGALENCQGSLQPKGLVTFGRATVVNETAPRTQVHGLTVRTATIYGSCGGPRFVIAKFDTELLLCGAANSNRRVENSIRVAPRVAVTAKGALLATPSTWRWRTVDGLRFATPSTWPVDHLDDIGCPWFSAYPATSALELVRASTSDATCPAPGAGHSIADSLVIGGRPTQSIRVQQRLRVNGVKFEVFRDAYADASGVLDLLAVTNSGATLVRFTFKEHDSGKVDREILDSMHSS